MKTIEIRIASAGSISVRPQGYTGKSCMEAIPRLQTLCDGSVVQPCFMETVEQTESYSQNFEEAKICPT